MIRFRRFWATHLQSMTPSTPRPGRAALARFAGLILIYHANGRELQPVDSQPTRLAARALARDGVLTLDRDIAEKPGLAQRLAFQKDLQGHTRSAYSVVPSIIAAIPAWILSRTAIRISCAAGAESHRVPDGVAAHGSGGHSRVPDALAWCRFAPPLHGHRPRRRHELLALVQPHVVAARDSCVRLGPRALGVAPPDAVADRRAFRFRRHRLGACRDVPPAGPPLAAILLLWMCVRAGLSRTLLAAGIVFAATLVLFVAQYRWFGHVLGGFAAMQLVALSPNAHGVTTSLSHEPWIGMVGLLVSPSRGILIFSPVVLLALVGFRRSLKALHDLRPGWLIAASAALFVVYGSYSVWWGGFTYGPRYMLDLLVPLTPAAAFGVEAALSRPWSRWLSTSLLAWSVLVAATGAFMYPNDAWNTSPESVDTHHERLWDWRDPQILRAWKRGLSPQNFALFDRASIRSPEKSR
jgi:hypothetical protein